MYKSIIFNSPLYEPPSMIDDYFRDGLPPCETHDFSFLGALIANWTDETDDLCLIYQNSDQPMFTRKDKDGLFKHPLTDTPLDLDCTPFQIRSIKKEEILRCFVSRFFQFRVLKDREQQELSFDYSTEDSLQTAYEQNVSCLQILENSLVLPYFSAALAPKDTGAEVFCIKDGWVEPEIKDWGTADCHVSYLICPHCLGNLDYSMQVTNYN